MNSFFNNKVVVITGGSDGIGKALIELLIPLGANISTCGRNTQKLQNLKDAFSSQQLFVMEADISNQNNCTQFIQSTLSHYGKIDILINNAGISMRSLLIDCDLDVIKKVMDVNFFGAVYCTKIALPALLQSKGTIVGISSIAAYRGLPGRSGYSASKFALNGWLEAIKTELLHTGVHVMWVCPGFTKSNIRNVALNEKGDAQGESPLEENNLMTSKECAQHILQAISKKKRTLILSAQGKQTVWLNKLFPSLADTLTYKFFFKKNKLIK